MKLKTSLLVAFAIALFAANTMQPSVARSQKTVKDAITSIGKGNILSADKIKDVEAALQNIPGKEGETLSKRWKGAVIQNDALKTQKSATIAEMPSKSDKSSKTKKKTAAERETKRTAEYDAPPAYDDSPIAYDPKTQGTRLNYSTSSASVSSPASSVASPASARVAEDAADEDYSDFSFGS